MLAKQVERYGQPGSYWWWLLILWLDPANAWASTETPVVSVEQVVQRYQSKVEQRLRPRFRFAGADWPPASITLLALKDRREMELWAGAGTDWRKIRVYRLKGLSGRLGPKLHEGDLQVPEGLYRVEWLNPNSAFHLSLKLNYPNTFDRRMAAREGRKNLGGNIFIHGDAQSRGCLAVGNSGVEELFVLAHIVGVEQVKVIIASRDFRQRPPGEDAYGLPDWVPELNRRLAGEMQSFSQD